jgi:transcriptional regulator with XRE-family HTH domain
MEVTMADTVFGRILRELREAKGLTQTELAALAGTHRQVVARLELGTNEPQWLTVQALAKALGVGVEVFTGETPRKRPAKGVSGDKAPAPRRRKKA